MIKIVKDNIVNMEVDAIVNAAKNTLQGGGGVDGAIHDAAGIKLYEACAKIGYCNTGEAVITDGFNLKAKYIIHTVGPVYFNHSKEEAKRLLINCYINSIELAKKHNVHSIAFPCISTGIYGYPLKEATSIVYKAVRDYLTNDNILEVYFVCFTDDEYECYLKEETKYLM